MTVEEIYTDREKFALNVREQAQMDVSKMGIRILSFVIKDVGDKEDYLDAIGRAETAKVISTATIEKANAERDAFLKEQACEKVWLIRYLTLPTSICRGGRLRTFIMFRLIQLTPTLE